MDAFAAIATLIVALLATRLILVRYSRYRRNTVAGREWLQFKAHLPRWVKCLETAIRTVLWLLLTFAIVVGLIIAYVAIHGGENGPRGFAFGLMVFASLYAALVPAFMLANLASWLIPPVRRANQLAFEGLQTASYRGAMIGLLKFGGVLLPICTVVSAFAVLEPWAH